MGGKGSGSKPCVQGCTCRRHESPVCAPGCTCKRHLAPGGPRPGSGRKEQDFMSISYNGQHWRVRRLHGKPNGYLCEGCCGRSEQSWARVHERIGLVLYADIVPLCWKCHHAYDHGPEVAAKGVV